MKAELFAYIGGLLKEKRARPLVIDGMSDHAHILTALPANLHASDTMKFVKANSSRWMKERFKIPFAWQRGFGAFSVSRSNIDAVAKYIREQEHHHQKFNFEKEYVSLLEKNGVEYDVEYLRK